MKIYNLDQLVSVTVKDKELISDIVYQPHRHFRFWKDEPAGFYYRTYSEYAIYTKEELEQGKWERTKLLVIDNLVYFKPFVMLTYSNDEKHFVKFETVEEANEYAMEITKDIKHKIIYE